MTRLSQPWPRSMGFKYPRKCNGSFLCRYHLRVRYSFHSGSRAGSSRRALGRSTAKSRVGLDPRLERSRLLGRRDELQEVAKRCDQAGGAVEASLGKSDGPWLTFEVDANSHSPVLLFHYPTTQPPALEYLKRSVKLEFGSLTDQRPTASHAVRPWIADVLPDAFADWHCDVVALDLHRSFWEKATILHAEHHRPARQADTRPICSPLRGHGRTRNSCLVAPHIGLRKRRDDAVHHDGAIHSWSGVRVRRGASYGPTLLDMNEPGRSDGAVAVRADGRVRPA